MKKLLKAILAELKALRAMLVSIHAPHERDDMHRTCKPTGW